MNGRLYDPVTGRMMQADPIIQDPYNPQNFNRYSYVMNNPLSFTDPTGFSWWTKWRRPIAAIAVAWAIGPAGFWSSTGGIAGNAFASTVAGGFAAGGISGGNLNSALQGAFFAAAFFGVGELSGAHSGLAMTGAQRAGQVAGHALVGCAQGAAAGGSCRGGAMSAGFAVAAGPNLPGADISVERFAARILVGAIAGKLGGGSYENGAMTAAFGYLFNEVGNCYQRGQCSEFVFGSPTDSGEIRGTDTNGCGGFDCTRRGNRPHLAIDYVASAGDDVLAPIDGKLVRRADPGTIGLAGLYIEGSSYSAKIFYVDVDEGLMGRFVKVGDVIGTAQEIRAAYGAPNMTNHIHLQLNSGKQRINPLSITNIRSPGQ